MNIFIDTNIFLGFYSLSDGDLEELRKIAKLAENGKIKLFFSDYLEGEFWRNRESVIARAISDFEKSRVELHLPNIAKTYDAAVELRNIKRDFETKLKRLNENIREDVENNRLKADSVIAEVLRSASRQVVESKIIQAAMLRYRLGHPPGKKDSCGDAVHWEWLLSVVPKEEVLFLISNDGDFESPLERGMVNGFLIREWAQKKSSSIVLFKTLAEFLSAYFPDIKLADEIDKISAIEHLEKTVTFRTTHRAVAKLMGFDDFSKNEVLRILNAYITNDQVHGILEDPDIHKFALKVVEMAYACELIDNAYPLEEMLNDLELEDWRKETTC
jgi:predicted nucleic acid-binding protein